jgi:hypothetical protein
MVYDPDDPASVASRDRLLEENGILAELSKQEPVFKRMTLAALGIAPRGPRRNLSDKSAHPATAYLDRAECVDLLVDILAHNHEWRLIRGRRFYYHPTHYVDDVTRAFADYLVDRYWPRLPDPVAKP